MDYLYFPRVFSSKFSDGPIYALGSIMIYWRNSTSFLSTNPQILIGNQSIKRFWVCQQLPFENDLYDEAFEIRFFLIFLLSKFQVFYIITQRVVLNHFHFYYTRHDNDFLQDVFLRSTHLYRSGINMEHTGGGPSRRHI